MIKESCNLIEWEPVFIDVFVKIYDNKLIIW